MIKHTAIAMTALLCSTQASAAERCTPSDVNGRWAAYTQINLNVWNECKFTVTNSRSISGQCRGYLIPWFHTTGAIELTRGCAFSGHIGNTRLFGTLQSNGQAGAGIALNSVSPESQDIDTLGSHFSLVRRP